MNLERRCLLIAGGLAAGSPLWSRAQERYPSRALKVIIPYTPGSGPDIVARTVGRALSERLGQALVPENKAGASGNIGVEALARAPADGYTLGVVANTFAMVAASGRVPYDPVQDFAPVGLVARGGMVLVTAGRSPLRDWRSFLEKVREKRGGVTYATPGRGTPQHLAMALLETLTDTDLLHVPYRGSAPAVSATLAGEVDCMVMPVHTALPFVRDGRLQAIGVTTLARSPFMPDQATLHESGLRGFDVDLWYAILMPARTPRAVLDTLVAETARVLREPAVASALGTQGLVPGFMPPAEFSAFLKQDLARWAEVIRRAGISLDES